MPFWWWWLGIKMKGCNFLFVFRCINIAVYVKTSQVNTKHIKKTPPNYFFPSCHYDYLWQNNSATQLDFYTRHFQSGTSSFLFIPSHSTYLSLWVFVSVYTAIFFEITEFTAWKIVIAIMPNHGYDYDDVEELREWVCAAHRRLNGLMTAWLIQYHFHHHDNM